ncbi:hypothetical protein DDB_G0271198 [Dictyostelium discoideum AX4]|uniref:Uncharacterized protein n=1 Tax=Dictyostelium discoideum TaxID=44689 RepID=Q55B74_DICDI|nr:hypothetical protein DDB_G0271198 [Dictyostelium discoideum AX4]EAL71729.1 hypothetical protein DDB_G0271198 [Dictyostelium discoideum AX4]|eukprot:XP_645738.1 hypothetical protein DDB_G0271198 [Dictyostelium discoideum AX4]
MQRFRWKNHLEFYGGSEHDITISRHSGLVDGEFNLEEDEKILAFY